MLLFVIGIILLAACCTSFQVEDRISALSMSQHGKARSEWLEIPLNMLPRFGVPEANVFHVTIPKQNQNSTDYKIDITKDLKLSLAFDRSKFKTPWLTVFDSENRKSIKKLSIYFTRDEFEIVKMDYKIEYGPKIAKIDPSHPTLRGFEIEYIWENVAEDDVLLGAQALFLSTIFGFLVLVTVVLWNANPDGMPISSDSEKKIKPKAASK